MEEPAKEALALIELVWQDEEGNIAFDNRWTVPWSQKEGLHQAIMEAIRHFEAKELP